jgi:Metal-dependent hydrolases of the beta-lactamase superfamily II
MEGLKFLMKEVSLMILKMLIENECSDKDLRKEHGLSLYLENQGRRLLFDTGASSAFIGNAGKMGINIDDIDHVVISHAHSDHGGGLLKFLESNSKASVFISDKSRNEFYFKMLLKKEKIGLPEEVFTRYCDRISFIDCFFQITEGMFLVGGFPHRYPLVKSSRNLFVKKDGKLVKDDFSHELALVIENDGKLVVITGCSHNGVENMIQAVLELFPNKPIQAVIGGFHLMNFLFKGRPGESRENVRGIAQRLEDYGIGKVYTCHCTGLPAYYILKDAIGDRLGYFETGMQIEI